MITRPCPRCQKELEWTEYEGQRVMRCATCRGHLVPAPRLRAIKRSDQLGADALMEEAARDFKGPTPIAASCPACKVRMRPEPIPVPGMDVHMDVCRSCQMVWLDGGELALLQLAYEQTPEYQEIAERRRRARELEACPERSARFQEDLSRLPDEPSLVGEIVHELVTEIATPRHRWGVWSAFRGLR